jgi:hypothetical protein
MNTKLGFKILFLIGCAVAFLGIFFDFYSYKTFIFIDTEISSWTYNQFEGWSSTVPPINAYLLFENFSRAFIPFIFLSSMLLENPPELSIHPLFHILFLGIIISSVCFLLVKKLESTKDLSDLTFYALLHIFLLMLVGFYVVVFPLFYLIPNDLYFPFIIINEAFFGITYHYYLGISYYLELIAFILLFPYAIFYLQTTRNYQMKEDYGQEFEQFKKHLTNQVDIDKLIAEEELCLKLKLNIPQKDGQIIKSSHNKR